MMARLNEPPAPVESVDALKRRFVRQNRDLARCNSNQSVKIRALETDLSHQLSENASLRVHILHLENEINELRSFDTRSSLAAFRKKLASQFDLILTDLAEVEKKPRRRKSQALAATSPKRSPQRREWRNSSTLSEVLASQGATMPTIMEGKAFPRRTMEQIDIQQLADSDSPDMAPPRTYYDNEAAMRPAMIVNSEEVPAQPMSAVEIRRRRRDSRMHERSSEDEDSVNPIKAGAKRKLSFSDSQRLDESEASPRKVLGDKAVNTDPIVSPQKPIRGGKEPTKPAPVRAIRLGAKDVVAVTSKAARPAPSVAPAVTRTRPAPGKPSDSKASVKPAASKPTSRPSSAQSQRSSTQAEPLTQAQSVVDSDLDIKAEPKTPGTALDNLLSPPSTAAEPTDNRPGTPPPSSMPTATTSADASAIGNGRSSLRRRGAAVSYAEPKLNVKMRRPGKELADAVVATASRERTSDAVKLEDSLLQFEATIKQESAHAPSAPGSPLAEKQRSTSAPSLPVAAPVPIARSALDIFEVDVNENSDMPGKATASRLHARENGKDLPSLPPEALTAGGAVKPASRRQTVGMSEDAAQMREVRVRSRRLSTMGPTAGEAGTGESVPASRRSGSVVELRAERTERALDRRRSMML